MTYKVLDRKKFRTAMATSAMSEEGQDIERIIDAAVELRRSYIAGVAAGDSQERIETRLRRIEDRRSDAHYNLDRALRALNLLGFPEEV